MLFENMVLRGTFGHERRELKENWRELHSEGLHGSYCSPGVVRVIIRSRRVRWTGHVACMGELRNAYTILVESLMRRSHSEDRGVDERIILKYILGK
jgi:hypothetical protein